MSLSKSSAAEGDEKKEEQEKKKGKKRSAPTRISFSRPGSPGAPRAG